MRMALRGAIAAAGIALAVLGGCSSTSSQTASTGAINTGTFPNLNVVPTSAATPISAGEKASLLWNIGKAHKSQAASGIGAPKANPIVLKKIAAEHADETLKKIEGK